MQTNNCENEIYKINNKVSFLVPKRLKKKEQKKEQTDKNKQTKKTTTTTNAKFVFSNFLSKNYLEHD